MMIRTVSFNLSEANPGKIAQISSVFNEARRVLQIYINYYWDCQEYTSKFTKFKVQSWLSPALLQVLGKQALDIMRGLKKKHKKSRPTLKNLTLTLDERFRSSLQTDKGHFDLWFRFTGLTARPVRTDLKMPLKAHRAYKKFMIQGWNLKRSFRLRFFEGQFFLDLIFEKQSPELVQEGTVLGIDMGFKNLITTSNGEFFGQDLKPVYEKLTRKKRGSKAHKRVLRHRNCLINRSVKSLDLHNVGVIAIEGLKNVKHKTRQKHKMHHKVMNSLQWWSYPKTTAKIRSMSEETGIRLVEVPPAYTSQTCSICGFRNRNNRHGSEFRCLKCQYVDHADFVGAVNIRQRGERLIHGFNEPVLST